MVFREFWNNILCRTKYNYIVFFYFSYDFLYVKDGATLVDTQLAALSGNPDDLTTLTQISTGSSMTLNFVSDSSEAKGGFVLQYEACKNNKTLKISKYANPNNIRKCIRRSNMFIYLTI